MSAPGLQRRAAGPGGIAVFRALMLGDMLCATPALRALRAGFPDAPITLIGLPWAAELAARLPSVDDFIAFPGHPAWPEVQSDVSALPAFFAKVQARRFELAVQLHGSGVQSNALVAMFGADRTAGFFVAGARPADVPQGSDVPWPDEGTEVERLLQLTDRLGAPRRGKHLDFPLRDADRRALRELWPALDAAMPYAVVHAGARLPSRRWAPARFAEVAAGLAARGLAIVLTGTRAEAGLAEALMAALPATRPAANVVNLCGRTNLWTLGALVERAALVVCNDTALSHIAAALARPSVVVSCGGDARRWAPQDMRLHRVLSAELPCRPCTHEHCPIGHLCAAAITPAAVLDAAQALARPPVAVLEPI